MIKTGIITEVDTAKARCRVKFSDLQGIISYWLPVVLPFTAPDQHYVMPSVGEAVACLMDENLEDGFIAGSYYHAKNPPPEGNGDGQKILSVFENGDSIEYDRMTGIATMKVKELRIEAIKVEITGLTHIALNSPLLILNVAQITSAPSGSYGSANVQMQIQSLDLDASSFIRLDPGAPLTINSKEAAVIGGVDSDGDTIVSSGQ